MANLKKETVDINGKKYVLTAIPAFKAQKLLVKAFSAISSGNVSEISDDVIMEILKYAGVINPNGAEVMLESEDLVNMMIDDPLDLLDLEERMVAKNFGFLGDGRFSEILSRLSRNLAVSTPSEKQSS